MKKIASVVALTFLASMLYAQSMSMIWANGMYESTGATPSYGNKIVLDASGNSYTTGTFQGTMDFDPGSGIYNLVASGGTQSVFILKLDANGNFVWAKNFTGTSSNAWCSSIALDAIGNVYTGGEFKGTIDFDPGVAIANSTAAGSGTAKDVFVVKLDPSGNYLWSRTFGGTNEENAFGINLDLTGNLYITGSFGSTVDFDPGPGTYTVTTGGFGSYLSKLNPSGNFLWARTIAAVTGSSFGQGRAIVTDKNNNVYYTGDFCGTLDFDPGVGVFNLTAPSGASNSSAFVSELDSLGNFVWSKKYGGGGMTIPQDLVIDTARNLHTVGLFYGTTDFDPGAGTLSYTAASSGSDVFISKLGPTGNLKWAKRIGNSYQDVGAGVAVDSVGSVFTTGYFTGTVDFNPGPANFMMTATGYSDVFISKLDSLGNFQMALHMGGVDASGTSIKVDNTDNIFITGSYVGTTDFAPGPGIYNLTSGSTNGVFVEKLHQSFLGISEQPKHFELSVFPNPTCGAFSVIVTEFMPDGLLEVYNTIGELIFSKKMIGQQNVIDLTDQSSGLYFVKVVSEDGVIGVKKIVKE